MDIHTFIESNALQTHLRAYGLGDVAILLDSAPTTATPTGCSLNVGTGFLHSTSAVTCEVIKNGNDDFLFWLTATTESKPFADYFPQMLPFDYWGITDADEFPFPNLASAIVDDMQWRYVYFSTPNKDKQTALWSLYGANPKPALTALEKSSGHETWVGGLYYTGKYTMPWEALLPEGSLWKNLMPVPQTGALPDVPVTGCIAQTGVLPDLKMQAELQLVAGTNPFGGDVVRALSLIFELKTPLQSIGVTSSLLNTREGRRIGLTGTIQIGSTAGISLTGSWPLDGDQILLRASCGFSDIGSYFNTNNGFTLPAVAKANAGITLYVSRKHCALDKISIKLDLEKWVLISDVLTLDNLVFKVDVYAPTTLKVVTATFSAKAKIGAVTLLCTGTYPDGDFYLGLDPEIPVSLGGLLSTLSGIKGILPDGLMIRALSGSYNAHRNYFSLVATVSDDKDKPWSPGSTEFRLENISVAISKGTRFDCLLKATFAVGTMTFNVVAIYSGTWYFSAGSVGNVSLKHVAKAFGIEDDDVPDDLSNCQFTALDLVFDAESGYKLVAGEVTATIGGVSGRVNLKIELDESGATFSGDLTLRIEGNDQRAHVEFTKKGEGQGHKLTVSLLLSIGNVVIELNADSESSGRITEQSFSGSASNLTLSLTDALTHLLTSVDPQFSTATLPITLPQLVLNSIYCTYDTKTATTNLIAAGTVEGKKLNFLFYKGKSAGDAAGESQYAFGLQTDGISLGNLPLIGEQVKDVKITNFGFVYTSAEGEYPMLSVDPVDATHSAQAKKYDKGFALSGELHYASDSPPLQLSLPSAMSSPDPSRQKGGAVRAAVVSSAKPETKWFKLDKRVGPVTLSQIGFEYENDTITLLISGGVAIAAISVSLDGLGISVNRSKLFEGKIDPTFSLDGIGLSYAAPPLEISGSFLKTTFNGADTYNGTAVLKTDAFSLSAMGSFTQVDGQTSLFVYAYLDKALGGPSFFYVEGLAAGFGYNRVLIMPPIDKVAEFPLVKQVMGDKDPAQATASSTAVLQAQLAKLSVHIQPKAGEMFLAVGVKFNTFKLINSFVLLAFSFAGRLEINMLGQSTLILPLDEKGEPVGNPLAKINILLTGKFVPEEGTLAILAQLSTDSYIFTKDCHLTGGAAFYSWFKGQHEGDFVVTMGGYHPDFVVPAHYPQVPRLALNWQLNSNLSVHGDMYFALCAHAFMAGGHLEIVYESGNFRAWFILGVDFLVTWQPYYYTARIHVEIGASLRVNAFFCSFTISINYGADVEIWGPNFSGRATVHIYCFDVRINFGNALEGGGKAIEWEPFKKSSLPASEKILSASITKGVHSEDKNKIIIVNPKELSVLIESQVPLKTFSVNRQNRSNTQDLSVFGVAPMDKDNGAIKSDLTIDIKKLKDNGNPNIDKDYEFLDSENYANLRINTTEKDVPAAIWGTKLQPDLNEKDRFIKVVNGIAIQAGEPKQNPIEGILFPDLNHIFYKAPLAERVNWQLNTDTLDFVDKTKAISLADRLGLNAMKQPVK